MGGDKAARGTTVRMEVPKPKPSQSQSRKEQQPQQGNKATTPPLPRTSPTTYQFKLFCSGQGVVSTIGGLSPGQLSQTGPQQSL